MIIFIADAFLRDYSGGAELTTDAIIKDSFVPTLQTYTQFMTVGAMKQHKNAFWIFGNFANLSEECLVYAAKNLNYSILEYDYKYCIHRSPEKHISISGECSCSNERRGKIVSIFLNAAKATWWMSENQMKHYQSMFPFLKNEKNRVLSSVFSEKTLDYIDSLECENKNNKWIILNSPSWIKGAKEAVDYAKENNLEYELVWGLDYLELLKKLAESKGTIFFPKAGDTCPRMIIEAKLLDCELILNDNVQHKDESWFETKKSCKEYLKERTKTFWDTIEQEIDFLPNPNKSTGPRYHIISPFYNAENFLDRCISSIKRQTHQDFRCILIDDMSTDNSFAVAEKCIDSDNRFTIIKNDEKNFALKNIVKAIEHSSPRKDDVIILLDGDDWFASSLALGHLNNYYEDKDCWLTYGSYIMHPYSTLGTEPSEYPQEVIKNNSYRKDKWRASHLRTFRFHVWDRIDKEDFKDKNGEYYKMAYDQAIMLPLIEMSSERCRYIPEVLHVYNKENPLNVDKIKAREQLETANEIRNKNRYERVK